MEEASTHKSVNERSRGIFTMALAFVFLFMGFITSGLFSDETYFQKDARKFEKVLQKKRKPAE